MFSPTVTVVRSIRSFWIIALLAAATFLGCLLIYLVIHEPVPRVHDEFSYLLMGETFGRGHVANRVPILPEFFDTFHVLVHPVYASKYFPAQGVFLAVGGKLTGHPAVGVWLSSALACAALTWMLAAWITPSWAILGGVLVVLQYGIYSYWSQTYWGGMVAALGGALAFGAIRRLWDAFSWNNAVWMAVGIVVLVNSRPLEGILALCPVGLLFLGRLWREKLWNRRGFWSGFVLPAGVILSIGAFLSCSYNRAITGSALRPPYLLHEQQYQESPQFSFLPTRPKLTYSSYWVQQYYDVREMHLYREQRDPKTLITGLAGRIVSWWEFYCGVLLSVPLVIPGLLRGGRVRYLQAALLMAIGLLWTISNQSSVVSRGFFDILVLAQIALLFIVFNEFWSRLAVATCALLIAEAAFVKWFFPHYFAPAACLLLYLEVEGLRRMWDWCPQSDVERKAISRSERRRLSRESKSGHWLVPKLRAFVYIVPFLCALSLVLKVEGRIHGWRQGIYDLNRLTLRMSDWSLQRAEIDQWLEKQTGPQLVFVRYSAHHNVYFEWVYNHADLMHAHVVWARDLGAEHNRLLLQAMPDRTAWSLEADLKNPQLVPYAQAPVNVPAPESHAIPREDHSDQ